MTPTLSVRLGHSKLEKAFHIMTNPNLIDFINERLRKRRERREDAAREVVMERIQSAQSSHLSKQQSVALQTSLIPTTSIASQLAENSQSPSFTFAPEWQLDSQFPQQSDTPISTYLTLSPCYSLTPVIAESLNGSKNCKAPEAVGMENLGWEGRSMKNVDMQGAECCEIESMIWPPQILFSKNLKKWRSRNRKKDLRLCTWTFDLAWRNPGNSQATMDNSHRYGPNEGPKIDVEARSKLLIFLGKLRNVSYGCMSANNYANDFMVRRDAISELTEDGGEEKPYSKTKSHMLLENGEQCSECGWLKTKSSEPRSEAMHWCICVSRRMSDGLQFALCANTTTLY